MLIKIIELILLKEVSGTKPLHSVRINLVRNPLVEWLVLLHLEWRCLSQIDASRKHKLELVSLTVSSSVLLTVVVGLLFSLI